MSDREDEGRDPEIVGQDDREEHMRLQHRVLSLPCALNCQARERAYQPWVNTADADPVV
jgi:hypothetical protein